MGAVNQHPINALLYITGAPASGKTSVADQLVALYGARRFSYGKALLEHPSLSGYTHAELRAESAKVVLEKAVRDLDVMSSQVGQAGDRR